MKENSIYIVYIVKGHSYFQVRGSPFIMLLCLGSIELDHVISELCYKGEPRPGRVITKSVL